MRLAFQSNFRFLFTHRREKRKTPFCSPQDLIEVLVDREAIL